MIDKKMKISKICTSVSLNLCPHYIACTIHYAGLNGFLGIFFVFGCQKVLLVYNHRCQ